MKLTLCYFLYNESTVSHSVFVEQQIIPFHRSLNLPNTRVLSRTRCATSTQTVNQQRMKPDVVSLFSMFVILSVP